VLVGIYERFLLTALVVLMSFESSNLQ